MESPLYLGVKILVGLVILFECRAFQPFSIKLYSLQPQLSLGSGFYPDDQKQEEETLPYSQQSTDWRLRRHELANPRALPPLDPPRPRAPPRTCPLCLGRQYVKCNVCRGSGEIPKTGFSKNNKVNLSKTVGSRWTACRSRGGHRHFEVIQKKGSRASETSFELTNTCGEEKYRIWVTLAEIKNKKEWRQGWVTLGEIEDGMEDRRPCNKCKAFRAIICPQCEGAGMIGLQDNDKETA
uniref:Uncharacterized protein n=2 Tax=Heterosigma akashiwo TaxID=2829 RepID=A0A6V1NXI5_HETAK|mmetsp:Transcript_23661/g.32745  ORF Transcript_23661/g.32745 Transcript_23661/m.32745 type:complete len:238 (+) Transcript_23661:112-825(+)